MKNIFLAALLLVSPFCFATLGQARATVQNDMQALGAVPGVATHGISDHPEIKVDSINYHGQIFKEYSDADGNVFAITWHGLHQPDLRPFLANFFPEFKALEDATPKGRRFGRRPYVTSEITVVRGGHLQDLNGIAYMNSRIPLGLSLDDLI